MSRKVRRVPVSLDSKGIKFLSSADIALILRGADELIGTGGRNLLSKVLKGSREKKVLELGLDESPAYGAMRALSLDDVKARVDWVILNGYLRIEYDGHLPVLVYTDRGWEIERETFAAEQLARLDAQIASGELEKSVEWLNEINPQVIHLILDQIEASGDPKYVSALKLCAACASHKIRGRINGVLRALL